MNFIRRRIRNMLHSQVTPAFLRGFGLLAVLFAVVSGSGLVPSSEIETAVLAWIGTEFLLAGVVLNRLPSLG